MGKQKQPEMDDFKNIPTDPLEDTSTLDTRFSRYRKQVVASLGYVVFFRMMSQCPSQKRNKQLNQLTSKIPVVTFIRLEHLKKGPCSKESPAFHYFSGDMLVLGEVLYICLVCFHVRV